MYAPESRITRQHLIGYAIRLKVAKLNKSRIFIRHMQHHLTLVCAAADRRSPNIAEPHPHTHESASQHIESDSAKVDTSEHGKAKEKVKATLSGRVDGQISHFFIPSHPLKRAKIAHIKSNEILIIVKKLILIVWTKAS